MQRRILLQDQARPPLPIWFEEMVDYKASESCCLNSKLQLKCLKALLVLIAVSDFSNVLKVRTRYD